MSALACPRCHTALPADASYGPCAACRSDIAAAATAAFAAKLEAVAAALADGFEWDPTESEWRRPTTVENGPSVHEPDPAAERRLQAKAAQLPRCEVCDRPLWVGQHTVHASCAGTDSHPGADAERNCRRCGLPLAAHHPCPICRDALEHHPGGETTIDEWAGLARMASAKAAAGGSLTALEAEALRRCPTPVHLCRMCEGYRPRPHDCVAPTPTPGRIPPAPRPAPAAAPPGTTPPPAPCAAPGASERPLAALAPGAAPWT